MKRLIVIIAVLAWAATGPAWAKTTVFVSVPPQKYIAAKIGGDLADVRIMVAPGASPATYEPKPDQMAALATAKLYFAVGVPFEKAWLPRLVGRNPELKVVHTEAGLAVKADHGHEHNHGHGGLDPHIWLDPKLVKASAGIMAAALAELDPTNQATYQANLAAFLDEADKLDRRLAELTAARPRPARIMVYHPAWGYFCRAYGFSQLAVEHEGKEPKPRRLGELIETARKLGIKTIFVQPQFSDRAAGAIARAVGGRVVPADPLAPDWAANLIRAAELFTKEAR